MIHALFAILLNLNGLHGPTLPNIGQKTQDADATKPSHTAKSAAIIPEKTVKRMIFTYGLYNSAFLNTLGMMPILLTPFYPRLLSKTAPLWLFAVTSIVLGRTAAYLCQPSLPKALQDWQESYDLFYRLPGMRNFSKMPPMSPQKRYNLTKPTPPEWINFRQSVRDSLTTRKGKTLYYMGMFTPWLCSILGALTLVAFPGIARFLKGIDSILVGPRRTLSLNIPLGALEKLDEDLSYQQKSCGIAKASPSTDDFSLVPPDVYNVIFKYLDGPDLLRAQLVSRTWYHTLQSYLQNQQYSNDHFYQSKGLFFANLALTPRTDLDTKRVLSISAPAINAHTEKANKSALKMMRAPLTVTSSMEILNLFSSSLTEAPTSVNAFTPASGYIGPLNLARGNYPAPLPTEVKNIYFNQPAIVQKLSKARPDPLLLKALLKNVQVLDLTSFVPSQASQPIFPLINICTYFLRPGFVNELHLDVRLMGYPAYRDVLSKLALGLNNPKLVLKMASMFTVYAQLIYFVNPLDLRAFPNITLDFTALNTMSNPDNINYIIFNDWLYDFPHKHITLKIGQSCWSPKVWQTENLLRDRRNLSAPLQHLNSASFIVPQDHYEDYRTTFQSMRLPAPFKIQLSTLETPTVIETIEIPKTN